jgi:hypothetical protein
VRRELERGKVDIGTKIVVINACRIGVDLVSHLCSCPKRVTYCFRISMAAF